MQDTPISIVVKKVGSQQRLGELLGVGQSVVSYWSRKHGRIPAERAIDLEAATGGEIPRWVSRPDLWEAPSNEAAE